MPLNRLYALLGAVVLAAGLSVAVAGWLAPGLFPAGRSLMTPVQWGGMIAVVLAVALLVRRLVRRG